MKIFFLVSLERGSAIWISPRPHASGFLENFAIWNEIGILQDNAKYRTAE